MSKYRKITIFIVITTLIFITGLITGFNINRANKQNDKANELIIPAEKKPSNMKFESISYSAKKVIPAVVYLSTNQITYTPKNGAIGYNPFNEIKHEKQKSLGTGIIITSNGYIMTNNHVIANTPEIFASLFDNRRFKAKIIGRDPKSDLAVIKINTKNLPFIRFSNSDNIQIGDIALAVGNPFGLGETVTMGIISATGRSNVGIADYEDFIQTDAAINPGNSGGPLVNLSGEIVGINTAILSKSGGYEGIGFAIPSNMAKEVFESIIKKGRVERGWIGIAILEVPLELANKLNISQSDGVIIVDVVKDSPATNAGIQKGDIITEINGKPIRDKGQIRNIIAQTQINKSVMLRILRNSKYKHISIRVSKLPDNPNQTYLEKYEFPAK